MHEEKGMVCMPPNQLEDLLEQAAERGALRALHDLGLDDEKAASDIKDMRTLMNVVRLTAGTVLQTTARYITIAIITLLIIGAVVKIKGVPIP